MQHLADILRSDYTYRNDCLPTIKYCLSTYQLGSSYTYIYVLCSSWLHNNLDKYLDRVVQRYSFKTGYNNNNQYL